MGVLMVYHDMVSRESKYVSKIWKKTIICALIGIMLTGLAATFNLHKMFKFFNTNCIIGAEIQFNCTPEIGRTPPLRTVRAIPIVHETLSQLSGIADSSLDSGLICRIDDKKSLWGPGLGCEYAIFVPLMMAIFATVWFVIFAMCGHGGRGTEAWFFESWRIVLPATIFFAIMSLINMIYLFLLFKNIYSFCRQLRRGYRIMNSDPAHFAICGFLFDIFSMEPIKQFSPWLNYNLLQAFVFVSAILWVFALAVMVARMVFVVDFQLIRVCITLIPRPDRTIRTIELAGSPKLHTLTSSRELYESASSNFDLRWAGEQRPLSATPHSETSRTRVIGESRAAITVNSRKGNQLLYKRGRTKEPENVELVRKDFFLSTQRPKRSGSPTIVIPRKRKSSHYRPMDREKSDPVSGERLRLLKNQMAKQDAHTHDLHKSKYYRTPFDPAIISDTEDDLNSSSSGSLVTPFKHIRKHDWDRARRRMTATYIPTISDDDVTIGPTPLPPTRKKATEKEEVVKPSPLPTIKAGEKETIVKPHHPVPRISVAPKSAVIPRSSKTLNAFKHKESVDQDWENTRGIMMRRRKSPVLETKAEKPLATILETTEEGAIGKNRNAAVFDLPRRRPGSTHIPKTDSESDDGEPKKLTPTRQNAQTHRDNAEPTVGDQNNDTPHKPKEVTDSKLLQTSFEHW